MTVQAGGSHLRERERGVQSELMEVEWKFGVGDGFFCCQWDEKLLGKFH